MSVPWKEGIKGIAKQSYYYRYFNLINPPQQSMLYDYYCQTMGFIDREVSSIIRLIEKDRDIKTRIREFEERFKEEENNSIKQEAALYKKLIKKPYPTKEEERILEWTKYFKGTKEKNVKKWSDKYCFFMLISSKNFYDAVKAQEKEIFTRSLLLSTSRVKLGTSIDQTMITQIDQNFKTALDKNQQLDALTKFLITGAFNKVVANAFGIKGSNRNANKKTIEATTFSKNLRDEIKQIFERTNIAIPDDKIELTNDNNKVFLRVTSGGLSENAFSKMQTKKIILQQLEDSDPKIKQQGLNTVIIAIKKSLMAGLQEVKDATTLDLIGIEDKLDLSGQKKREQFFKQAENYIMNSNGLEKFIKSQEEKTIKYTFIAIKSNEFVSGFLGELSSALSFQKGRLSVEMTGGSFGEIQGSSFGANVNDLTVSAGNKTFGVNVKHYVTSNNTITLYNSQKHALDLNSDYLNKYYTKEEIKVMRWAVENQFFIEKQYSGQKNFAKNVAYHYSWEEIPSFLRIEDKTENSVTNLFFQLNNVIYPTSYIYSQIRNNLKTLLLKQGGKNTPFFSITYSQKKKNLEYLDRDEALEKYTDATSYNNLHKISATQNGVLKIKTHGLKINLASLHLFK